MQHKLAWFVASICALAFFGAVTWYAMAWYTMAHVPIRVPFADEASQRICAGSSMLSITAFVLAFVGYLTFDLPRSEKVGFVLTAMVGLSAAAFLAGIVVCGIAWSGSWTGAIPGALLAVIGALFLTTMSAGDWLLPGPLSLVSVFLLLSAGILLYGYMG